MKPWFQYSAFHWKRPHAIVIGAGIAGCQISWHLCQTGWQVTLLEKEKHISRQASGNLAGVISPKMTAQKSPGEQFYQQAFEYTTSQLQHLIKQGATIDWYPCGMLQLAHNTRELQRWESLKQRQLSAEFIQLVSAHHASKIAGLTCDYPASYFPQAGYINPASFAHALIQHKHCQLIPNTDVQALQRQGAQWQAMDIQGNILAGAEVVIISNGKDLNLLSHSQMLPVAGVLGQTTLASTTTSHAPSCVIGHEGYLTPSYQDVHVFGATFDRQFETVMLNTESDQRNIQQLKQYLPTYAKSLEGLKSGHAAVRATTPDRYPYAGAIPDTQYFKHSYNALKHGNPKQAYPDAQYQQGLFVLGGFGSRGLTTSGLCAQLLSQLINGQIVSKEQQVLLETLHPARFLIRQLKRGQA